MSQTTTPTGSITVTDTQDLRTALRAGYHGSQIEILQPDHDAAIQARHAGYAAGLLAGKAQAAGTRADIGAEHHDDARALPTAAVLPVVAHSSWEAITKKHTALPGPQADASPQQPIGGAAHSGWVKITHRHKAAAKAQIARLPTINLGSE